uniref:Peptide deformylase n=1 Tax=Photinus pyralis TaxID=7054 RepID=A0A1Y1KG07_PHOPY
MNSKLPYTVSLNLYRKLSFGKFKSWYCGLVKKAPPIPPYSHIIQTGDPALRVVSEQVPNNLVHTPEIKFLMQRLKSVFERYGCVGLSACQIGIPLRIIIVEFNNNHMKQYSAEESRY